MGAHVYNCSIFNTTEHERPENAIVFFPHTTIYLTLVCFCITIVHIILFIAAEPFV